MVPTGTNVTGGPTRGGSGRHGGVGGSSPGTAAAAGRRHNPVTPDGPDTATSMSPAAVTTSAVTGPGSGSAVAHNVPSASMRSSRGPAASQIAPSAAGAGAATAPSRRASRAVLVSPQAGSAPPATTSTVADAGVGVIRSSRRSAIRRPPAGSGTVAAGSTGRVPGGKLIDSTGRKVAARRCSPW